MKCIFCKEEKKNHEMLTSNMCDNCFYLMQKEQKEIFGKEKDNKTGKHSLLWDFYVEKFNKKWDSRCKNV